VDIWYSPNEINFQREENIWLICHLETLSGGKWPPEYRETGYIGSSRSGIGHAPFETPIQFAAEIKERLKTTKRAGETLVWEVQHGAEEYRDLSPFAKRALNYISGWRRRRIPFPEWLAQSKYREGRLY